jgi:hypothetical protein
MSFRDQDSVTDHLSSLKCVFFRGSQRGWNTCRARDRTRLEYPDREAVQERCERRAPCQGKSSEVGVAFAVTGSALVTGVQSGWVTGVLLEAP